MGPESAVHTLERTSRAHSLGSIPRSRKNVQLQSKAISGRLSRYADVLGDDREVVSYSPFSFMSNVGTQLWDGLCYPNWRGWPAADDPTCWLGPLMVDGGTCCGAPPACGSALASSLAFMPSGPAIT